jgi:hypothetical protein
MLPATWACGGSVSVGIVMALERRADRIGFHCSPGDRADKKEASTAPGSAAQGRNKRAFTAHVVFECRLGEAEAEGGAAIEAAWSQDWGGGGAGQGVLAAALEAAEARCSALERDNARLRLSLVRAGPCRCGGRMPCQQPPPAPEPQSMGVLCCQLSIRMPALLTCFARKEHGQSVVPVSHSCDAKRRHHP